MLDALLVKELGEPDELEAVFIQALYWSIGAGLLEDGRVKFDQQVKGLAAMQNVTDDDKTRAGLGKYLDQARGYKTFIMLNSTEHEISTDH